MTCLNPLTSKLYAYLRKAGRRLRLITRPFIEGYNFEYMLERSGHVALNFVLNEKKPAAHGFIADWL